MNIKRKILVNLGQFENEPPPLLKTFQKWHFVLGLQAKSIQNKPCFNDGFKNILKVLYFLSLIFSSELPAKLDFSLRSGPVYSVVYLFPRS